MDKPLSEINEIGLLVADRIEAMLAYWDKDEVCRFANNAYMEWFGKSREEMVDKMTLKELLGPIYEMNLPFVKEALKGNVQQFEREITTPGGSLRYSLANYYPDIKDGEVRGFIVHVADISKQKKAEKKYNILFDSIDEGFCIIEMIFNDQKNPVDYRFLEVNASFERQTGLQNVVGKRIREFAPNDGDNWFEIFGEVALTGESLRFENFTQQLNRWYECYAFRWGEPKNFQVAIIFNDISDRKKSEEHLKESEDKFRNLFNFSPVGITLANTDVKLLEANPAFFEMMGLASIEEFMDKPAEEYYVKPEVRSQMMNLLEKDGFVKGFEFKIFKKNGEHAWISNYLAPFKFGNKNTQLISASIDITARKQTEEKLVEANKELESFSYSVAHDLRAPLRAVHGYSSILEQEYEDIFDPEAKRIFEMIKSNISKMGQLIDDLLAFSRLGRKEVNSSKLNMNELTQSAIDEINKSVSHKSKIIVRNLPEVMGDTSLLSQVMINLLSNAIKYSSKKDEPIIHIFSEVKNGEITFSVQDNGAGFDMNYYDKLFGVFQRLHSESEFEGTGVGLAIAHRIISKHGGKIWAEGIVDEGATFNFTLPVI